MASYSEFIQWLDEYSRRFPAMRDYTNRHDASALADTWFRNTGAFPLDILQQVMSGIVDGNITPVPNTQLGQFGLEIRQRASELVERNRRAEEQKQASDTHRQQRETFSPLVKGKLDYMKRCAEACLQLLDERGIESPPLRAYTNASTRLRCTVPYEAAIILADDHTDAEERVCRKTLADVGISWEEIQRRT